jgi:hypothetical protein
LARPATADRPRRALTASARAERGGHDPFGGCPVSGLMRQPGLVEERRISGSS